MKIWAISSYFNPQRFSSRYRNFVAFRDALTLPLLTVEWSQHGDFQLSAADSDVLISVSGGDLMWQKERLLNVAIAALPPSCEVVVWLDCDILFEDDRWIDKLEAALCDAPIVQLFSEVVHLDPTGAATPLLVRKSLAATLNHGSPADIGQQIRSGAFSQNGAPLANGYAEQQERTRLQSRPSSGHAWAARRTLLKRHGLYDGCICGAGDMAIALAAFGKQDLFLDSFPLNETQKLHYRAWADPFAESTGGDVGFLSTRIHHLFHGLLSNRQYSSRLQQASESGFDPGKDLLLDEHCLWRWNSDRRPGDTWMREYFKARSEDELPAPNAAN
jgi:hypothetical protein